MNDAFGSAHRAHATTTGVAAQAYFPAVAGFLMEKELNALGEALNNPERPFVAIQGGAKISDKITVLNRLLEMADNVLIGGGMANTFLAAQGYNVGQSLCEHDLQDTARAILAEAKADSCEIILPVDVVVAREFKEFADNQTVAANACPRDSMILDAGPKSIESICKHLDQVKTVIWNGPLGAFELPPFNTATDTVALKVAELTEDGQVLSVAGGGDTVAALKKSGAADSFSYISTAGGAFLEWMEGKTLPGVAALIDSTQTA